MSAQTPNSFEYALSRNDPALLPPRTRAVRVLIEFLRWRFSMAPVGALHWDPATASSPEQSGSEIYISGDTPLPAGYINGRPAITVLPAQMQYQGTGIGDLAFHDLRNDAKARMDLMPTTLIINCLARLPVAAERLAGIVHDEVWALRELLMKVEKGILHTGSRATISAPGPAGAMLDPPDPKASMVSIYFPTYLQHHVANLPLNKPILGGVNTTTKVR